MVLKTATEVSSRAWRSDYLNRLTDDALLALVRSASTADAPLLHRQLCEVLVELAAARELRSGKMDCLPSVVDAVEAHALAKAGEFVAEALGPRLIVDAEDEAHEALVALVGTMGSLTHLFEQSLDFVAVETAGRVIERNETLTELVPESEWEAMLATANDKSLSQIAYSAGYTLSSMEYFPSAGMAAPAFSAAVLPAYRSINVTNSSLAVAEDAGSWELDSHRTTAVRSGAEWRIDGEKCFVTGLSNARVVLVVARADEGPCLFAVDVSASGLSIASHGSLDRDRSLARIVFDDAPAKLIGHQGTGARALDVSMDKASATLGAEQMGIVDRSLRMLSELPPSINDSESWRRYTRELASMEVLRWSAIALWFRSMRLRNCEQEGVSSVASAIAHIACTSAARRVAQRLQTAGSSECDPETVDAVCTRARSADLLLGGPIAADKRLLERLGM